MPQRLEGQNNTVRSASTQRKEHKRSKGFKNPLAKTIDPFHEDINKLLSDDKQLSQKESKALIKFIQTGHRSDYRGKTPQSLCTAMIKLAESYADVNHTKRSDINNIIKKGLYENIPALINGFMNPEDKNKVGLNIPKFLFENNDKTKTFNRNGNNLFKAIQKIYESDHIKYGFLKNLKNQLRPYETELPGGPRHVYIRPEQANRYIPPNPPDSNTTELPGGPGHVYIRPAQDNIAESSDISDKITTEVSDVSEERHESPRQNNTFIPPNPSDGTTSTKVPKSSSLQQAHSSSSELHIAVQNSQPSGHSGEIETLSGRFATYQEGATGLLGKGYYGTVKSGVAKRDEQEIRSVAKESFKPQDVDDELKAASILQINGLRNHDNIAYIVGQRQNKKKDLIMQRYDKLPKKLPEQLTPELTKALVKGLNQVVKDMLDKGIRHNDVHFGNIMQETDKKGKITVKLIDFGLLTQSDNEQERMLGLVDYYKQAERAQKQFQDDMMKIQIQPGTDISGETYLIQVAMGENCTQDSPALRNHPLRALDFALYHHKLNKGIFQRSNKQEDQKEKLRQDIASILENEVKLYRIHAALRYTEKKGSLVNVPNIHKDIRELLSTHAGDPFNGLKYEAEKLAKKIKGDFKRISPEIAAIAS